MAVLIITLITFGEILAMPFMNTFWITQSVQHNRGQYVVLYTIYCSVAQTFGMVLGAKGADHYGFYSLWWILGLVCLFAALGYLLLGRSLDRSTKYSFKT